MFKVLLETEACEWENSGEGKEMPKKMIQVSIKKCFLTSQNLSRHKLKTISAVITGLATATHFISAEHWLEIPGL